MTNELKPASSLFPVKGITLSSTSAGIYKRKIRNDVMLIGISDQSTVTAVFTKNAFFAAPVAVARKHLLSCTPQYCLVNAGNANAGTGEKGIEDAFETCKAVANLGGCPPESVLPFSTGVIGEELPVDKISAVIPELIENLSETNWNACAEAIMTTDTVPKSISKQVEIEGNTITITGITKGSGMIRPDMATMLAFIGTDACVEQPALNLLLKNAVEISFNRICVDGDMSTNDACILIATGKSTHQAISDDKGEAYKILQAAINEVCIFLAQAIVRDGEGATKFISITVDKGRTRGECLSVGYAIATSSLVKTAFFASDPNWGRILATIGRAGIDDLDVNRVSIYLNGCCIVKNGSVDKDYTEEQGMKVMLVEDIDLNISLDRGGENEVIWTCDLSHDYVSINAEYRT